MNGTIDKEEDIGVKKEGEKKESSSAPQDSVEAAPLSAASEEECPGDAPEEDFGDKDEEDDFEASGDDDIADEDDSDEEDDDNDDEEDDEDDLEGVSARVHEQEEDQFMRSSTDELAQDEVFDKSHGREPGSGGGRSDGPERGRRFTNARELLTEELGQRVQRANSRLRSNLTGSIVFELDGRDKYIFDWSTEALNIGPTDSDKADCVIKISEDNLMKVASGDLNPQVGMLSDKIFVSGRLGLAIYIFNLIAPRGFMH